MKSTHTILLAALGIALSLPAAAQPGPGGGRFAFGGDNTPGWSLMTPDERAAHRQQMLSFKTYDECKAYQAEHHQSMADRAREAGKTLPQPRANACDRMKAGGLLK